MNSDGKKLIDVLMMERDQLRAENERLRAALDEFAKWSAEGTRGGMGSGLFMYPVLSPSARNEMQRVVEAALYAPAKEATNG